MLGFATAAIISVWFSAPLYGINCLLTVFCAYALARRGVFKGSNWALAIVIGVQWILCTGHIISLFAQLIHGFIHPPTPPPLGSAARNSSHLPDNATASSFYFQDQCTPEHTAEVAFYVLNGVMADCFMAWRVYVIYDRKIWLIAPFMIINLITLVFGGLVVRAQSGVGYDLALYFTGAVRQRALVVWALSVGTQTAGTLLISYRELSTPVHVPSSRTPRYCTLKSAACAVVDSGAAYILGVIKTLAFYLHRRTEGAVIVAILGQIAVTVPLTIIAREWWKVVRPGFRQGSLLPRSALIRDRHDMQPQEALRLAPRRSQDAEGVNVCVVKSTHMDIHSITTCDEGLKNAQLGSFSEV
ncbi:unnamed protein product [Peniophora sp. CBMAI 1063]|nr:unnamed protein product [Peniophora sp. CBMAI 1063]